MTEKQKKLAAKTLKELIYDGMLRKNAIIQVCRQFCISRATLYRYVKQFGVNIK